MTARLEDRDPDLTQLAGVVPEARRLLSAAAARTREIRRLEARLVESARERRALMLTALEVPGAGVRGRPKNGQVSLTWARLAAAVGLADPERNPSGVGDELRLARHERDTVKDSATLDNI